MKSPTTSKEAKEVLSAFLTGDGPREFDYSMNTLLKNDPNGYFTRQIGGVLNYMQKKYGTEFLKNGYSVTSYSTGGFSPLDASIGFIDGVQIGDVVGTLTGGMNLVIKDNNMYFSATNDTTLTSFAAENFLSSVGQGSNIINPTSGPFSTVSQNFTLVRPIPKSLLAPPPPSPRK